MIGCGKNYLQAYLNSENEKKGEQSGAGYDAQGAPSPDP
jgi:hypothetical protein